RMSQGYEQFYQRARLMPRILGAYVKVERAYIRGANLMARPGAWDEARPGEKQNMRSYKILEKHFRILMNCDDFMQAHPDLAVSTVDFIDKVAARARGDDLSRLRHRVIALAAPGTHWAEMLKIKTKRGFKNTLTGRLLCPITKIQKFDEDPAAFCRAVRNAQIKIHSRDWPLFLYDEKDVVPGKVKPGLLRSPLLVKCYQVIFTGPQSAEDDVQEASKSTGKPSLSAKYNMVGVTPETICYIAALASAELPSMLPY
ncbi:hypothetical protein GY45DRAFT_1250122, partial [Cubamyces sp. BRFM 1775]